MSDQPVKTAGLIVLPRADADAATRTIGAKRVIDQVIERVQRVPGVSRVVVVTDCEQVVEVAVPVLKAAEAMKLPGRIARAWSATTWRGGIGGATAYDEVIDPAALAGAMKQIECPSALVVGATWLGVDSALCGRLIERHRQNPAEFKFVFTQAPPGFAGVVVTSELLEQMAGDGSTIGHMLDYHPQHPQGDPIARDICVQIEAGLRQASVRAIAGARRWEKLMPTPMPDSADEAAAKMVQALEARGHDQPGMATLEVTAKRHTSGPLRIQADRPDMTLDAAKRWLAELGRIDDVALMFGGVGDVLCHEQWAEIVAAARDAGIKAIAMETDLLVESDAIDTLIALKVDVVKVRLNADSAAMYQRMMGVDGFEKVCGNMQRLLKHRLAAGSERLPWVVPTMIKTRENVTELESFVDRWSYFAGAVLVEGPPQTLEELAVIDMAPPRRFACRQLLGRMTVLSDGRVARCDQAPASDEGKTLTEGWSRIRQLRSEQCAGRYEGICENCRQWHRP